MQRNDGGIVGGGGLSVGTIAAAMDDAVVSQQLNTCTGYRVPNPYQQELRTGETVAFNAVVTSLGDSVVSKPLSSKLR